MHSTPILLVMFQRYSERLIAVTFATLGDTELIAVGQPMKFAEE